MAFDKFIASQERLPEVQVRNLAEMIFHPMDQRDENAEVILSHAGNCYLVIRLPEFRSILMQLYMAFRKKGFKAGDTILLAGISGNNECYLALLFCALASYGMRVLLPMFMERHELDRWIRVTGCMAVIYPAIEIRLLNHHEKEKQLLSEIETAAEAHGIPLFDNLGDFNMAGLVNDPLPSIKSLDPTILDQVFASSDAGTEALIITTSGSSGKSRLVVYEQGAFIRSCLSWEKAGFFREDRFGGRGFTPLFTHTMGIRAFFNALWNGHPVCLINTEYFTEKPEIVRYFLLQMKPEHMTGGPASFKLLLEMMRNFPEIKNELRTDMKTIVSSGAIIDPDIISDMESVFNVTVHNAFGTTETQQVLSTLISNGKGERDRNLMGAPLPGVKIGLQKFADKDLYRMFVRSAFGCKYIISENHDNSMENTYLRTGDIVRCQDQKLTYIGRENSDFFKDGFGVKIPLDMTRDHYRDVLKKCTHLEFYPLLHEPGLAGLIFAGKYHTRQFYTRTINTVNDRLYRELDPFYYRHLILRRFALVHDPPPGTAKGSIARHEIRERYNDLIADLVSVFPTRENINTLEVKDEIYDPFTLHLNAYVGGLLHELKMDMSFHRARKDSLFTRRGEEEIEVLDLTGGYGTNLLGHNHDELVETASKFLQSGRISLSNQGSLQETSGRLAERLSQVVGGFTNRNYKVCLGSTGAEMIEMALHHACLQWRHRANVIRDHQFQHFGGAEGNLIRQVWEKNLERVKNCNLHVVVSASGFHGHSSGARALLSDYKKRAGYSNLLALIPIFIDDRKPGWKEEYKAASNKACIEIERLVMNGNKPAVEKVSVSTIIAALFEPVTGEGGIRTVDPEFLRFFSVQDYPLILDEIQSGLGRTGSLPTYPDVPASYYVFAKALGGGIEKIGALLVDATCYQSAFDKEYSSTFANGELASEVALRVLDIIEKENIPAKARERGQKITACLEKLRSEFPDVITAISGRGLMQGIEFRDFSSSDNIMLRLLSDNSMLGYLYASYLLNRHNIRALPSMSASNVLRIEPSAYICDEEISHIGEAIRELAETISHGRLYRLFEHLMEYDQFGDNKGKAPENGYFYGGIDPPAPGARQVSIIGHFIYPGDELRAFERDFMNASDTGLRILANSMQRIMDMEPATVFKKNIFQGRVHFSCRMIPLDSALLERSHREGNRRKLVRRIQKAIDIAVEEGSEIISLGGYTSILTNNGLSVSAPGHVRIITGNTLTVASGLQRVYDAMEQYGFSQHKNVLAIVGSSGNIGTILAEQLVLRADLFEEVILIGRNRKRMDHFYRELQDEVNIPDGISVTMETGLQCLGRCNVIINSTNTNDPVIFPHHINPGSKVLIVDNSVPAGVSREVLEMHNVISLQFASYIRLPQDPDFVISSFAPKGTAYCCAAEVMLCGLEEIPFRLKGKIANKAVMHVREVAKKYGFFKSMGEIGSFKTKD
jgi:acetylornithine/succinyldiaminopimelate/putrescine aminotransferase/predicted amino acid dehydrogenase/acyl-coenzyme A synthetase/AMP-(fatty) acid ligase